MLREQESCVCPCAIRKNAVGDVRDNSILFIVYGNWVHESCSGVMGSLSNSICFTSSVCNGD